MHLQLDNHGPKHEQLARSLRQAIRSGQLQSGSKLPSTRMLSENLGLSRRESLHDVVNRSINQTLSRTVISSGLTFLTVMSLYLFGGEVLHGFSFALVVGILIGTYSSIAVAAPMLVAYQDWRAKRGKVATLPAGKKAKA